MLVAVDGDSVFYPPARRRGLLERFQEVGILGAAGKLENVDLSNGELKISPISDQTPEAAAELGRSAYDALPRIKITELLLAVDGWVGFGVCFIHQRSGRAPEDRAALHPTKTGQPAGRERVVQKG